MSSYLTKKTDGDTAWFVQDRFGMFIHFGLYSMAARHEWVKTQEQICEEHYDKYFKNSLICLMQPNGQKKQKRQV